MGITDFEKMISQPSVKSLQKRLNECYRRLKEKRVAITHTVHKSPRSSRRRSRRSRRDRHRSRRSRPPTFGRKRSYTRRSPRSSSRRSRRKY